jgi:hypothetical protein
MRPVKLILLSLLSCITSIVSAQVDTSAILKTFTKVDKEAAYPGGEQAWKKFLERNLNANVPVDNGAPIGQYTVFVQFVIDTNGNTSDIKALTDWGYGMEKEVIRLIQKSGQWTPAMLNGKPVGAYRKQPVTFDISEEGTDITPNVLYAGRDNELTVQIEKVKGNDLRLTISQGTITPKGDGKFIVRVNKPGRVIIEVFGKKNKKLTEVSLEVKETAR